MRKALRVPVIFLVTVPLLGCASIYMEDRTLDFVDCFKLQRGVGGFADVEIKATDWIASGAGYTVQNRRSGWEGRRYVESREGHVGLPLTPLVNLLYPGPLYEEGKEWGAVRWAMGIFVTDVCHRGAFLRDVSRGKRVDTYREEMTCSVLGLNLMAIPGVRKATAEGHQAKPLVDAFDVEASATVLLFGGRVGFGFGQFVDFLLGWATIDIAGDDELSEAYRERKARPLPQAPNPAGG